MADARAAVVEGVARDLGRTLSLRTVLFHAAVAERLGLNVTDHKCLDVIWAADGRMAAGELAIASGLTTGAVTGVLDRLERAGFVRRVPDPGDRRRVLVEADPGRVEEVAALFASLGAGMHELAGRYTDDELAVIADFTRRAGDLLDAETRKLRDKRPARSQGTPSAGGGRWSGTPAS